MAHTFLCDRACSVLNQRDAVAQRAATTPRRHRGVLYSVALFTVVGGALVGACEPSAKTPRSMDSAANSANAVPSISASVLPSAAASQTMANSAQAQMTFRFADCEVLVSLVADKTRFLVEEPVYITLRFTSQCEKALYILDGGDYRNRFGRANSYQFEVLSPSSARLPILDPGPEFGGISGPRQVGKSKSFEKRLLLAHWVTLTAPGKYQVKVSKTIEIGEQNTPNEADKTKVPVSLAQEVEVLPNNPIARSAMIDAWGKALVVDNSDRAHEAERALAMIQDEQVLRYYAEVFDGDNEGIKNSVLFALRNYPNEKAIELLHKALSQEHHKLSAAQALSENTHPKAWDYLWAARGDNEMNIRLTVLHALAKRKDPDAVEKIKAFLKDPAEIIRKEAERYLRERNANPSPVRPSQPKQ